MAKLITSVLTLALLMACAAGVLAKPDYLEPFIQRYKGNSGPLEQKSCASCHTSVSDYSLNLYGKLIAQEMIASNSRQLTSAILQKTDGLDADGDEVSNAEEFKAGTDPADPKSVDPNSPKTGTAPPTTPTETEEKAKSLIPKNAYHPAIVHFPIALFIAGLLLDFIGYRKKNQTLLFAGWYNLVLAAVTALGGLLSGYVATLQMKIPISGLIQQHMITAVASTIIMWILVAVRLHRHEKISVPLRLLYYVLAAGALALVSYSGHMGGVFVYGE